MIPRRIKYQLDDYLRYALGEILLIVIGILIAVGVYNWNLNQLDQQKEDYYLQALQAELEEQLDEIDKRLKHVGHGIQAIDAILVQYRKDGSLVPSSKLNSNLKLLLSETDLKVKSTTFDELNSIGLLDIIRTDSLRSKVISCYQELYNRGEHIKHNSKSVSSPLILPVIASFIDFNFLQSAHEELHNKYRDPDSQLQLIKAIHLNRLVFLTCDQALKSSHDEVLETLDLVTREILESKGRIKS